MPATHRCVLAAWFAAGHPRLTTDACARQGRALVHARARAHHQTYGGIGSTPSQCSFAILSQMARLTRHHRGACRTAPHTFMCPVQANGMSAAKLGELVGPALVQPPVRKAGRQLQHTYNPGTVCAFLIQDYAKLFGIEPFATPCAPQLAGQLQAQDARPRNVSDSVLDNAEGPAGISAQTLHARRPEQSGPQRMHNLLTSINPQRGMLTSEVNKIGRQPRRSISGTRSPRLSSPHVRSNICSQTLSAVLDTLLILRFSLTPSSLEHIHCT